MADASEYFRRAVTVLDGPAAQEEQAFALGTLLSQARPQDAFTLWHLLDRLPPESRPAVLRRLVKLVPAAAGVPRKRVLAGGTGGPRRALGQAGAGSDGPLAPLVGRPLTIDRTCDASRALERNLRRHVERASPAPTFQAGGIPSMQKITTFLTFNNQAEEAVNFYTSTFKNSKITSTSRYPEGIPGAGSLMTASFELDGQEFIALNGGPTFSFSQGFSLMVSCETQAEIDELWSKLTAGGKRSPAAG